MSHWGFRVCLTGENVQNGARIWIESHLYSMAGNHIALVDRRVLSESGTQKKDYLLSKCIYTYLLLRVPAGRLQDPIPSDSTHRPLQSGISCQPRHMSSSLLLIACNGTNVKRTVPRSRHVSGLTFSNLTDHERNGRIRCFKCRRPVLVRQNGRTTERPFLYHNANPSVWARGGPTEDIAAQRLAE
jgi:hypothetical protein